MYNYLYIYMVFAESHNWEQSIARQIAILVQMTCAACVFLFCFVIDLLISRKRANQCLCQFQASTDLYIDHLYEGKEKVRTDRFQELRQFLKFIN